MNIVGQYMASYVSFLQIASNQLANDKNIYYYLCRNQYNMSKRIFLRDYPKKEEPRIFNGFDYDPTKLSIYRKEISEFFQKLGLKTTRKSIDGKEYIEGTFLDKLNRTVSLRFFLIGCYRNIEIEGDPYIRDIRMFKTMYRESPNIGIKE